MTAPRTCKGEAGFTLVGEPTFLPHQYFLVFTAR